MKIIKTVSQSEVFDHWGRVERINIAQGARSDIISPLLSCSNLKWHLADLEKSDLASLYIISSDDWRNEGLCVPDFRLLTVVENYNQSKKQSGKFKNIKAKEDILNTNPDVLDTRLILVSDDKAEAYTLIEGNKRAIALAAIGRLVGLEVYLGISPAIKDYIWCRHTYK